MTAVKIAVSLPERLVQQARRAVGEGGRRQARLARDGVATLAPGGGASLG